MEAKPDSKEIAEFSDFLAQKLRDKGKKDIGGQDIKDILDPKPGTLLHDCEQCANGWRW